MNNETEQIYVINTSESQTSATPQKGGEVARVNLENVEDFSNVCRTCAAVTEFVMPIFDGEGLENNLAEKIHKHLPIQVSEQDVLPRVVCYQCASTLLAWHELVQCCVQADAALRTRLAVIADARTQHEQKTTNNEEERITENEDTTKSEAVQMFNAIVQTVLVEYINALNLDEYNDFKIVCQKCNELQASTTIESLAEHLYRVHTSEVTDKHNIETFIKNNITFEEILTIDDDTDTEMDTEAMEESKCEIPSLFCPFCECIFSSSIRLACHLNRHVELNIENGIICCDNTYDNKKSFVQHLQEQHVSKTRDIASAVCRSCGFIGEDAGSLQIHVTVNHSETKTVREHETRKNKQSPKNQKYIPAVCPECNRTFSNKYNMLIHMKSHSGQAETYVCDKCNKSYSNRGNLTNHVKLAHKGVLSYLCSSCGEAFPTRGARDIHARLHSGLKPFTCTYCNKSFRAKNTLDRHIEMHLNIRKYECHLCAKRFRKSTHLKYHISTHKRKT